MFKLGFIETKEISSTVIKNFISSVLFFLQSEDPKRTKAKSVDIVRCQSIWVQGRLKLRDDLVHLVNVIMRRFCCVASAVLQRSFV